MSHEDLRAWATNEASKVIQVILTWQSGEIYFEDGIQPPADRLLVALSPAALLPPTAVVAEAIQSQQYEQSNVSPQIEPELHETIEPPRSAPLLSAAQFITETPPLAASNPATTATSFSALNMFSEANSHALPPLSQPIRVSQPQPPMRIDTSFMRPEMVLKPLDLSALRQRSPELQITPEQWLVLTRVNGRTTLQTACLELSMPATLLCQIAGELIALGLIHVALPQASISGGFSRTSSELITTGSNNGYGTQGYAANPPASWVANPPVADALPSAFDAPVPFETTSQWGNGGTGATFVPGHGWVANPSPMQPLQAGAALYTANGAYIPVGSGR